MTPAAHIIKNQLTRAGNSACLVTGAGRSLPFFCTLQQTWRKNKSNFTDRQTPIGRVDNYKLNETFSFYNEEFRYFTKR